MQHCRHFFCDSSPILEETRNISGNGSVYPRSPLLLRNTNLIITLQTDLPVLNGARPSAGTLMIINFMRWYDGAIQDVGGDLWWHYDDVIMGVIASQITSLTIVYSTVYSGAYQSKHQSSASLAFVRGIHRGPVNSPHIWWRHHEFHCIAGL